MTGQTWLMAISDEFRDPAAWGIAGVTGAGAALVGAQAGIATVGMVALGVGLGALVLGVKAVAGSFSNRPKQHGSSAAAKVRPDSLPRPTPGSAQANLVKRSRDASRRLEVLTRTPGDPWLRGQVDTVDDEARAAASALADLAGRVELIDQSLAGLNLGWLAAEDARTRSALDAATDQRLIGELQLSLAALADQRTAADRMALARSTLLARMNAATLGLEGLVARVSELVAVGTTNVDPDRSRAVLDRLTGDLDSLRAGISEAQQFTLPSIEP
jgi:hypothetical protein